MGTAFTRRPLRAPAAAVALAVALLGLASPPAAAAEEAPAKETIYATRLYRTSQLPDLEVLKVMVEEASAQHAGVLGITPYAARDVLDADWGGGGEAKLRLTVDLRNAIANNHRPKMRATEFLDAAAKTLEERLRAWQTAEYRIEHWEGAAAQARAEYEKRRAQVRDVEEKVRHITGRSDTSLTKIGAALPELEQKRETLRLEVLGKQARQEALAKSIDRLTKAAAERVQADPVAAELQNIVQAREVSVERVARLHQTGNAPEAELAEAKAKVFEARARLLERREAVQQTNGGDLLARLNHELATLSIDIAEGEARLKAVEDMINKQADARQILEQNADLPREKARYQQLWEEAEASLRNVRERMPNAAIQLLVAQSFAPDDPRFAGVDGALPGAPAAP